MQIEIKSKKLTDGSKVFDVYLVRADGQKIDLPAYTEKDAAELARKVSEAINEHTTLGAPFIAS